MERKRVLIMGDSCKLHTGFAKVAKEVWTYLNKTGKYDIKMIGWFHQDSPEEVNFPIVTTNKDENGNITQDDKYAHKSFAGYVDQFKPELVWTIGDHWMVDHVAGVKNRNTFKWIMYTPIDGHPIPGKWNKAYENADVVVAYGKYGMEIIKQRSPSANLKYIYHGVSTNVFRPIPDFARLEARRSIIGVNDDKIVLGIVARNQPRKSFDKLFEAYYYILSGNYNKCNDCGLVSVDQYDLIKRQTYEPKLHCKHCQSENITRGVSRDDVRLYIHAAIVDCGWDLMDLQNDYNLTGKILVNPALKIGVGLPEHTLNGVYNAIDIFTLPTRGEGFGLPVLEAMSAGIPVCVTDYSAHPEWARGCGEMVPAIALEAEPLTNIRRAVIDIDKYVGSLLRLIDSKALRDAYGARGREVALTMDWNIIGKQWEGIVDSILFPEGNAPEKIELKDLKYSLEEM